MSSLKSSSSRMNSGNGGEGTAAFYAAKVGGIGMTTFYFLVLGTLFTYIVDKVFPKFDLAEYKAKNFLTIFFEIFAQVFLVGILAYLARAIVRRIPYPFEGTGGFRHADLKELNGGVFISFCVVLFLSNNLGSKITYLVTERIDTPPVITP